MRNFICYFEFNGIGREVEIAELCYVENGFWLDSEWKFTQETDKLRFWVPASRVLYVKLETEAEVEAKRE